MHHACFGCAVLVAIFYGVYLCKVACAEMLTLRAEFLAGSSRYSATSALSSASCLYSPALLHACKHIITSHFCNLLGCCGHFRIPQQESFKTQVQPYRCQDTSLLQIERISRALRMITPAIWRDIVGYNGAIAAPFCNDGL